MLLCKGRDIIAEWINENIYVRKQLRRLYQRTATVSTKVVKKQKKKKSTKFHQYFDWSEPLSSAIASFISHAAQLTKVL
jgi:uncharacterized protein